ncbi:MAG: hypothetical protein EAZ97_06125 [Bacteroidetes bacterium]|nr:MAG: hypothetical protein EAZ97_06125 [Bacteroidota bacterium]
MKKLNILSIIFLCSLSISCFSQINQEARENLAKIKLNLQTQLDSSIYYFDLIIKEHNQGVGKSILIKKYAQKIEEAETSIDQTVEKANDVAQESNLSEEEYENWIKGINFNQISVKYQEIKVLGFDFKGLPITQEYPLSQLYQDSINRFSIHFPDNWEIVEDDRFTLVVHSNYLANKEKMAGFGIDINEMSKNFSTEQYYHGNMKSINKAYQNLKITEEEDINLNGMLVKYVVYQYSMNEKKLKCMQFFFTKDKKGYVINGTSANNVFDTYRSLFIEIARSFKLD